MIKLSKERLNFRVRRSENIVNIEGTEYSIDDLCYEVEENGGEWIAIKRTLRAAQKIFTVVQPRPAWSANLNRRGQQYIGRVFSLTAPITNGVGKVTEDDSTWKVKGPDLPTGTHIRVTGVDGVIFKVESAE